MKMAPLGKTFVKVSQILMEHGKIFTVFHQINPSCALTDTLINSGGPEAYFKAFSAIFANF